MNIETQTQDGPSGMGRWVATFKLVEVGTPLSARARVKASSPNVDAVCQCQLMTTTQAYHHFLGLIGSHHIR